VLKLATLSLAALLTLASPAFAANKCITPDKFAGATKIVGDDLVKFREHAKGLPEQVDLVLLIKPVAIAFVKGCAVGYGVLAPAAKPADDGSI
jgi:hypothetical protein